MRPQMVIYPLSGGMKMVKKKLKLWYFGKCLIKLIQFLSKRKTMANFCMGCSFSLVRAISQFTLYGCIFQFLAVYSQHYYQVVPTLHWCSLIQLGGERHCENEVSFPRTKQNDPIKAQTWIARSIHSNALASFAYGS